MLLAPLIPLLESVPGLGGRVEVCARYADGIAQNKTGPYAWLCEMRGDGGSNHIAMSGDNDAKAKTRQERRQKFSVMTLVSNASDNTGRKALDLSTTLRQGIHDAILGALVRDDYEPVLYERDIIIDRSDGRLYWADEFYIVHQLRSQS